MTSTSTSVDINAKDTHTKIVEGTATMYYDKKEAVFYNKVQVFNRDLSIQVIRLFSETIRNERIASAEQKFHKRHYQHQTGSIVPNLENTQPVGITILDALAATGLRSVRYLKEIEGVSKVTINDILPAATSQACENCRVNNVDESKVIINTGDATMLMYGHRDPKDQYDVIDLDPYGSATPFVDAAVQAVRDGGLLCVTCTDMTVLSGNYPEVCFSKYSSMPLKISSLHEMSLRILLHYIDSTANKYSRYIVPWLSISVDFYVRVFVRIFESPAEVKRSSLRRGMLYQSSQCPSFFVQPLGTCVAGKKLTKSMINTDSNVKATENEAKTSHQNNTGMKFTSSKVVVPSSCPETGGNMKIGGPFWTDPIHKQDVVDQLLQRVTNPPPHTNDFTNPPSTSSRITGILTSVSEELKDVPFHYLLTDLASTIRVIVPSMMEMQSALINAGYRVSQFHREPLAIKTDAPDHVVWDIMRAFAKLHPPEISKHKQYSEAAKSILEKTSLLENVDFTIASETRHRKRVARYLPNPEENWGPKRRAGRKHLSADEDTNDVDSNDDQMMDENNVSSSIEHSAN